jgi:diacylglycerol O-acyltransferase / wax synthase
MEQLSGLDALFLHAEMHGTPMHLSMLSIYDPSSAPGGKVDFRQILDLFERNIQFNLPLLRHKLMEVPLNLDQPYWVEDPNFDLVYHIRHIALPKPGNWQKLCSLAANLHAQPLSRGRPLWEAYVIDGLDHIDDIPAGCFAILLKVHHSMMDGKTGMAVFNSIHTLASGENFQKNGSNIAIDEARFFSHQPEINLPKLLAKAAVNNLYRVGSLVRLMGRAVALYSEVRHATRTSELKQLQKPKTRFNGHVSPRRVVDRIRLPIEKVNQIKSHAKEHTINDIALTIISGALRRYLLSKDELPEDSLVAAMPIDVRSEDDENYSGNRLSITNISLRTDVVKPLDRLHRVHKEVLAGNAYAHTLGNNIVNETMDNLYVGLVSWGVKTAVESGVLDKFPPANNTIVTNIPGSQEQLFLCGATLIDSFGMGPLIPNTGLFHAISSTCKYVTISFTADRQKMDDPDFYVQCLQESFSELLEAAR